jgi:hypothetical protein
MASREKAFAAEGWSEEDAIEELFGLRFEADEIDEGGEEIGRLNEGLMWLGQATIMGTRTPPSNMEALPPLRGALRVGEVSSTTLYMLPPLSERKTMKVLWSVPCLLLEGGAGALCVGEDYGGWTVPLYCAEWISGEVIYWQVLLACIFGMRAD